MELEHMEHISCRTARTIAGIHINSGSYNQHQRSYSIQSAILKKSDVIKRTDRYNVLVFIS